LQQTEHYFECFCHSLYQHPEFADVPFKIAVEDDGKSFCWLTIKVRKKIVADGLSDGTFDSSNSGKHLNAAEFNAMTAPIVIEISSFIATSSVVVGVPPPLSWRETVVIFRQNEPGSQQTKASGRTFRRLKI